MTSKHFFYGALLVLSICINASALTPQQQAAAAASNLNAGIKSLYNQAYAVSTTCSFPGCNITGVSLQAQLNAANEKQTKLNDMYQKARAAINSTPTSVLNQGTTAAFEYQSKIEQLLYSNGATVNSLQAQIDKQKKAAEAASAQQAALNTLAKSYPDATVIASSSRPYKAVNLAQYKQGNVLVNETILKRSGDASNGLTYVQAVSAYSSAPIGKPVLYVWGACAKSGADARMCSY